MTQTGRARNTVRSSHLFSAATETSASAASVAAVFSMLPGGVIGGSEIVLMAMKPSMWRPVFDSAAWLVSAGVLAAMVVVVGQPIPGLSLTATAQVLVLVGLVRLGFAIAAWLACWHVLTNRRLIDIRGVRVPQVSSCGLTEIRNTYLRRSGAEYLTGTGSILFVMTQQNQAAWSWRVLSRPELVHGKIRRAIEGAIDQHG